MNSVASQKKKQTRDEAPSSSRGASRRQGCLAWCSGRLQKGPVPSPCSFPWVGRVIPSLPAARKTRSCWPSSLSGVVFGKLTRKSRPGPWEHGRGEAPVPVDGRVPHLWLLLWNSCRDSSGAKEII